MVNLIITKMGCMNISLTKNTTFRQRPRANGTYSQSRFVPKVLAR